MWLRIAGFLAVVTAAFALADWHGLVLSRVEARPDFARFAYRTVDAASGAPIAAAHVTCTRPGTGAACTERPGAAPGVIELTFGVVRHVERTLLFERDRGMSVSHAGPLTVTFIHPDYERSSQPLGADDVAGSAAEPREVRLVLAEE